MPPCPPPPSWRRCAPAGGELLEDVRVFDLYEGAQVAEGKKSLALRLSFRAPDRTLSEDEVNELRRRMLEKMKAELGAELQGLELDGDDVAAARRSRLLRRAGRCVYAWTCMNLQCACIFTHSTGNERKVRV